MTASPTRTTRIAVRCRAIVGGTDGAVVALTRPPPVVPPAAPHSVRHRGRTARPRSRRGSCSALGVVGRRHLLRGLQLPADLSLPPSRRPCRWPIHLRRLRLRPL